MFIQVVEGRVSDAGRLRAAMDEWLEGLAPGADGWLGSTAGVTDDGRFVALVRFESQDAARRNSDRPEQDQWWTETAKLLTGDVTFHDCRESVSFGRGGSDDAGFVQVIQGRVRDVERMRALNEQAESAWGDFRPDVIGGIVALHGDGGFTNAVYFTSEEEARAGEGAEPPVELKALMEEEQSLYEGDLRFFDLRVPWLSSPR
jgi:hypothetical protein